MLLVARVAAAQPAPTPDEPPGGPLWLGFALGGGAFAGTCNDCGAYGGVAEEVHFGWAFSDRFALGGQISAIGNPQGIDNNYLVFVIADAIARVHVTRAAWLEGGAGLGRMWFGDPCGPTAAGIATEYRASTTLAAGWDFYLSPRFRADLELRSSVLYLDDPVWDVGVSLGLDWHLPIAAQ